MRSTGAFTNGEGAGASVPAGHSIERLGQMLDDRVENPMVGDDEQYAALLAVLARSLGLPSRVVMGFRAPSDGGEVKGADLHAWTEVAFAGIGWVPFSPTPDPSHEPRPQTQKKKAASANDPVPPPPLAFQPPESIPDRDPSSHPEQAKKPERGEIFELPVGLLIAIGAISAPVWIALGFVGAVIALKRRRRSRRRTHGSPSQRIAGGWREVIDVGRDLGHQPAPTATRAEAAASIVAGAGLDGEHATRLGRVGAEADAATFGPAAPDDIAAAGYWHQVEDARRSLTDGLSRRRRFRAATRLTSLRTRR
jgi:hypothetical protein